MSDRNYPSGLTGPDDSQPDKRLSSLFVSDSTAQLSTVAGSNPVAQLSAVAGSNPVAQLSAVAGSNPVAQLSSVQAGSNPVAQLSVVYGSNPVIQHVSVGDPYPLAQPSTLTGGLTGPHPIIQMNPINFDFDDAFSWPESTLIEEMDTNALVELLGIPQSMDERTKLQDDPATYTNLLPPSPEASHGQPVGVVDFEEMQCDQPQPVTLHREQGREFLEQLVSSCQGDGTQASQTASPSPPDAAPEKTKRRKRQSSAANPAGEARQAKRRRQKQKKKYELDQPLEDPAEEKKRLNAINSKKNRENKKQQLKELDDRVKMVTSEKKKLELEVQQLRKTEEVLRKAIADRFGITFPEL